MLNLFMSTKDDRALSNRVFLSNNIYAIKYTLSFINTGDYALKMKLDEIVLDMMEQIKDDRLICLVIHKMYNLEILAPHVDKYLLLAIEHKRFHVIRFLLLKGGNAKIVDSEGKSLLQHLIYHQQHLLVELLIEHYDIDVNSVNAEGENVIFSAIENNACNVSNSLIQLGTQLNCKDSQGITLLQRCIEKNWYLHMNFIISKGGLDFIYDEELFHTYCHIAIKVNSILIFDKLIRHYFAYIIQKHWRAYRASLLYL